MVLPYGRSNLFVKQVWPSLAQILHVTIFLSVLISHANMSSAAAVYCAVHVQGAWFYTFCVCEWKILKHDHSNEGYWAVVFWGAVHYAVQHEWF